MVDTTQWEMTDELNDVPEFWVYVLVFHDGEGGLYVGHTNNLSVRLIEHAFGDTASTRGRPFKLGASLSLPSRAMAAATETRLSKLADKDPVELARAIYKVSNMVPFAVVDIDVLKLAAGLVNPKL